MGGILPVVIKYNLNISHEDVQFHLKRIINQVYKLLPTREEGNEWQKPLETIIEELCGMERLLNDHMIIFFPLLCKLEGLFSLTQPSDFSLYRRIIFECLGLLNNIKENVTEFE